MMDKKPMPSLLIRPRIKKKITLLRNEDFMTNILRSNMNVFVQGVVPTLLTNAMTSSIISQKLSGINVYTRNQKQYNNKNFHVVSQTTPMLFTQNIVKLDLALIQMSPPDQEGVCSLGPCVGVSLEAIQNAKCVICQINHNVPRTQGDALVHISNVDVVVEADTPLHTNIITHSSPEDIEIGRLIATNLIPDGATLQIGVDSNALLDPLGSHKGLGVHSEVLHDWIVELIKKGVVDNSHKTLDPGISVATFLSRSKKILEFSHNNSKIELRDITYTNNPSIIMKHKNMISINSAVRVDITGQIYTNLWCDGQLNFIYGASMSDGGKTIIALRSRTPNKEPRIVPFLNHRLGVITTKNHTGYIVTEYGIASLSGKSVSEQTKAIIQIAHPDDRPMLTFAAKKQKLI